MSSKGSLWSHLKALCCDYVALLQNEDSTDAEFDTVIDHAAETIAAQHKQEVARVRKDAWTEAEAHFAPYVAAFRLFEQYSEGGGLTPAETLEKVAEVLDNLSNALAEQIDRAVAAEEENAGLRRQLGELLAVVKDLAEALIATTNTLEFADPNAPAVELANEVIEKHVKVIGPLIEEARRGGEK